MKSANVSWDKSFNSENIYIDFEQYETFCKEVLKEEYKEAIDFLNIKDEHPIVKFFKDLGDKTREDIIKEMAGGIVKTAKIGVKNIPLLLSMI